MELFLVAEMGLEPHVLAKFSAENLASCHKSCLWQLGGSDSPPDCHSLPLGRSQNALRFAHYLRVIRPSGDCSKKMLYMWVRLILLDNMASSLSFPHSFRVVTHIISKDSEKSRGFMIVCWNNYIINSKLCHWSVCFANMKQKPCGF